MFSRGLDDLRVICSHLQTGNMTSVFCILAVLTVRRVARLHCQLDKVCFLRAASDGHLAADEKRAQLTHGVSRREVVARIVAREEHRALDADAAVASAHHDGSASRRSF